MKTGLLRVLRVRQLLEELAGVDLETRSAELRRLEEAADEQHRQAATIRKEALNQRLRGAGFDSRLGTADAEILAWKSERLRAAAQESRVAVEAAREQMMARRVERRQAEALIAEAAQEEQGEGMRREQHRLDEWFRNAGPSDRRSP